MPDMEDVPQHARQPLEHLKDVHDRLTVTGYGTLSYSEKEELRQAIEAALPADSARSVMRSHYESRVVKRRDGIRIAQVALQTAYAVATADSRNTVEYER